jgi:hypothetical protein
VHTDSPVKTLKDLADLAKSKPGQLTVGTTGIGSDDHLAMLLFERQAGVKMNHIPMKGAADVRTAIMSRQIDVAAMNIGEALQYVAGGSPMRQLGTMSLARSSLSPNVPTFAEQGYQIEMASLRGMAAPKGLPPEIKQQLIAAIQKAAADPEFQAQAVKFYAPLRYLGPAEFEKVLRQIEVDFQALWSWRRNIRRAGFRLPNRRQGITGKCNVLAYELAISHRAVRMLNGEAQCCRCTVCWTGRHRVAYEKIERITRSRNANNGNSQSCGNCRKA